MVELPGSPSKRPGSKVAGKARVRSLFLQGVLIGLCFVFILTSFKLIFSSRQHSASKVHTQHSRALNEHRDELNHGKKKLLAFVGVQTGFTKDYSKERYVYETRRDMLRKTWFPSPIDELDKFEATTNIRVRFVIGHSPDSEAEYRLQLEQTEHNDFIRLDFEEDYLSLTFKTLSYFRYVVDHFDAEYIVKIDDDVYFRLERVPIAVPQWRTKKADYVGCMKRGEVFTSESTRWYEPQHALLGRNYYTHCWGSIYVLSGRAAHLISGIPEGSLRFFNNEDTTMGGWMLALNVTHFDDRRLCTRRCGPYSLAVFNSICSGLCAPHEDLVKLHEDAACHEKPDYMPVVKEILPVSQSGSRRIPQKRSFEGTAS